MKISDRKQTIALVKEVLTEYHNLLKIHSDLDSRLIIDSQNQSYVLMIFGSYKQRKIYECLVHFITYEEYDYLENLTVVRYIKAKISEDFKCNLTPLTLGKK